MNFPASLTTRIVKGRFVTVSPTGSVIAAKGAARIILENLMQGPSDDTFVAPFDAVFKFDDNGEVSVVLPSNNDPQWTPGTYRVVVIVDGKVAHRQKFDVPYNGTGPIDLADILNIPATTPGESYLLLASKGVGGGVASLDENGVLEATQVPAELGGDILWTDVQGKPATFPPSTHSHVLSDVTELVEELSDKASVVHAHAIGDVTGLVSALFDKASVSDLASGLAGKLPITSPEIVDSTLTVRKGDDSSAMRMRGTGSAVDYDIHGDIIVSSWSGADFTGDQTNLQRWRGDGTTLAGRTNFSAGVYGDEQYVDGDTSTTHLVNLEVTGTVTGIETSDIPGLNVGLSGFVSPTDHGLCGWTFPPEAVQEEGTILPTAGLSYVTRLRVLKTTISAINIHVVVAGIDLTNCFASLHNDAGAILGLGAVTEDHSTTLESVGYKSLPLVTPQGSLTPGNFYKIRWWVGGATTLPTLARGSNVSAAILNAGLSAPNFRYATADSDLTTVASAPSNIGTMTAGPTAWWVSLTE